MAGFGICGKNLATTKSSDFFNSLKLSDVNLNCITYNHLEEKDIESINLGEEQVIVKVLAFSCNYRDLGLIINSAKKCLIMV